MLGRSQGHWGHRRSFIGGSDARIIMGDNEPRCLASGGRNEVRRSRKTCRAI